MDKLLELVEKNPRLSNKELGVMLGLTEQETEERIRKYEQDGTIKGYRALIDKEKANDETVSALIEIKVQPKFSHGFDELANTIAQLDEVESIFLMSGGYDLCCTVSDKTFQEVAMFVANRLSPMEGIVSTATHFILKRYKEKGIVLQGESKDDRGTISF